MPADKGTRDFSNTTLVDTDQEIAVVTTPTQELDSASPQSRETTYVNSNWPIYNGYYRKNQGGTKAGITKYATWIAGRGFTAKESVMKILKEIKGNGKDTAKGIFQNMLRVKKINGDSFSEVITSDGKEVKEDLSNLINIKPLNAGKIQIVENMSGIIIGYDQLDKNKNVVGNRLKPWQIFHLSNDREGDEIHGISVYEGSTEMLDRIEQLDNDMTIVFHRYVMPLMMFEAKTDKTGELNELKAQLKESINKGQSMIIPTGAMKGDAIKIPQFSTLDPILWRKEWKGEAIKDLGIPELHLGSADGTVDASAKMVYLGFEQPINDEQEEFESQLFSQIGIELKLTPPRSIEDNVQGDETKDGPLEGEAKGETTPGTIKQEGKNPSNSSPTAKV